MFVRGSLRDLANVLPPGREPARRGIYGAPDVSRGNGMNAPLKLLAVDDEPLALKRVQLLLARVPGTELVELRPASPKRSWRSTRIGPTSCCSTSRWPARLVSISWTLFWSYVPQVIFVTAFDEFATRAFEVGAVDYVLKPVELTRFTAAIEKARKALAVQDAEERLEELRHVVAALRAQARIRRPSATRRRLGGTAQRVRAHLHLGSRLGGSERDYVRLHAAGQSYLLRDTISAVQGRLDPDLFVRSVGQRGCGSTV